jgi:hypothetical protein
LTGPSGNEPAPITLSAEDVQSLRALLQIANDRSCAEGTRELARRGIAGYLSSLLGEPAVIEEGVCDEPESDGEEPRPVTGRSRTRAVGRGRAGIHPAGLRW